MRVTVVGAGSWGTTVAGLTCHNADTTLWARRKELADELTADRTNTAYLPDIRLPEALRATCELEEAVSPAVVIVMAVPSHGYRDVAAEASKFIRPWVPVVTLSKGIERNTLKRMSEVTEDEMPGHPVAVLTGPNLAKEIAAVVREGVSLQQLVDGLNALGIGPRDLIAILQAIKAAGAIQAEIEVM